MSANPKEVGMAELLEATAASPEAQARLAARTFASQVVLVTGDALTAPSKLQSLEADLSLLIEAFVESVSPA